MDVSFKRESSNLHVFLTRFSVLDFGMVKIVEVWLYLKLNFDEFLELIAPCASHTENRLHGRANRYFARRFSHDFALILLLLLLGLI